MKKKILVFSVLSFMFLGLTATYSSIKNTITGNITANAKDWSFKATVNNATVEEDYYKIPVSNTTSGNFTVTFDTNGSNKTADYSVELSGPTGIVFYLDGAFSSQISNNIYSGTIKKNTTETLTLYYKSSNSISGNIIVKIKGIIKEGTLLYSYITNRAVMDNIKSTYVTGTSGIAFNRGSSDTNGKGVYIRSGTETSTYPVYYYRGVVTNNNVIFANFCWKIVRTTETGGIKLIYNGAPTDGKCNNTGTSSQLSSMVKFNANDSIGLDGKQEAIGYMYGPTTYNFHQLTEFKAHLNDTTTASYTETLGGTSITRTRHKVNAYSSLAKLAVDNWYKTNIDAKGYTSMLEDTIWCADRTIYKDENDTVENGWRYMAYSRNSKPSLTCSRALDRFTVSTANGNGDLEYPVGLLTYDEMILVGYNASNYLKTGQGFWGMTPYSTENGWPTVSVQTNGGSPSSSGINNKNGIRPSISLKEGAFVSGGDGTSNSPYIIES